MAVLDRGAPGAAEAGGSPIRRRRRGAGGVASLWAALALLLTLGAAGCYRSPTALADKGEAALRAYQLDEAEAAFMAALEKDPTLPRALYGLGWIYFSRADNQRARMYFERCIQMDPSYFGCHRGMGSLHLNMGYYAQAEESLKRALALKAGEPSVLSSLGHLYLATDRLAEAEPLFQQALAAEPERGEVYFGLAELRFRQGRLDDALKLLDEGSQRPIVEVKFQELIHELKARVFASKAAETIRGRGDPPAQPFAGEAEALYQRSVDEIDAALETAVLKEKHRLWRLRQRMLAERDRLADGRVRGQQP